VGEEKELSSLLTGFGRKPESKKLAKRASKKK
jgi:hypothetical protein